MTTTHSATQLSFVNSPSFAVPDVGGRRVIIALAIAAMGASAQAAISDTIHPYASLGYSYDDNLLRLPDGVQGVYGRSDTATQLQAGVNLERPIGRQLLKADLRVSRVSFSHYDVLNYNGKDFTGEWQWAVLNDFSGHIGGAYSQTLTPFVDYHDSERNLRTYRRRYADGKWRVLASWEVYGGVDRSVYNYDLAAQRYSDRTENIADLGLNYLAASGSRFGLLTRHRKGEYPNPLLRAGVPINNNYTQDEVKADIYWRVSGITQVQLLAGWARRNYLDAPTRDDNRGADGRITGYWAPTGKLKFTLSGWREFAAVESSTLVSSSLNRGASLGGNWQATAKLVGDFQVRRETRNFAKLNTVVLPGDASDVSNRASVGLTYGPTQTTQINLSTYRENRSGSLYVVGTGSYTSKGASLSLSGQF